MIRYLICWISILVMPWVLNGQSFKGGLIGGINASQINGDSHAGFDKVGLHLGLKVSRSFRDKMDLSVELLYSERGSTTDRNIGDPFTIRVNYVEIPVLVALKDWLKDDYHKMHFEFGGSVGRIIKSEVSDIISDRPLEDLNNTDISGIVGATWFRSSQLGFSFRYTHSVIPLRKGKTSLPEPQSQYRGYFLSLRVIYFLSS